MAPRIALGMTLHNNAPYLPAAVESLLGQTHGDFRLFMLDDGSSDATEEVGREYARRDPRLSYHRNPGRAGMVAAWRGVFEIAWAGWPEGPPDYFAWASDHDVWHREWLRKLLDAPGGREDVLLSYADCVRIDEEGKPYEGQPPPEVCETCGVARRAARVRSVCRSGNAGSMVYGLFRAAALRRAGVFRRVLLPDRLLLEELSLYGEIRQVREVLWLRRFRKPVTLARQRQALFVDGARPLHAYAPWWVTHAASMAWRAGLGGGGPAGRFEAAGIGLSCLWIGARRHFVRRVRDLARGVRLRLLGPRRAAPPSPRPERTVAT